MLRLQIHAKGGGVHILTVNIFPIRTTKTNVTVTNTCKGGRDAHNNCQYISYTDHQTTVTATDRHTCQRGGVHIITINLFRILTTKANVTTDTCKGGGVHIPTVNIFRILTSKSNVTATDTRKAGCT